MAQVSQITQLSISIGPLVGRRRLLPWSILSTVTPHLLLVLCERQHPAAKTILFTETYLFNGLVKVGLQQILTDMIYGIQKDTGGGERAAFPCHLLRANCNTRNV